MKKKGIWEDQDSNNNWRKFKKGIWEDSNNKEELNPNRGDWILIEFEEEI